jgi:hypothetical protein
MRYVTAPLGCYLPPIGRTVEAGETVELDEDPVVDQLVAQGWTEEEPPEEEPDDDTSTDVGASDGEE